MNKLLIVSGFGWSGSGLLIDILSSTNSWETFPAEFRLIKDKGGIIDLLNSSEYPSRIFNYSIELENFENLCNVLGRTNSIKFGLNYNLITNYRFSIAAKKLIYSLKSQYYYSDAFVFQYSNNLLQDIYWKFSRKFNKSDRLKKRFLPLDQNRLISEIFDFFDFLFPIGDKKQIILDQAIDAGDHKTINLLSEKFSMITVDRDPRDIFVDYCKSKDVMFDVYSFIDYFKISRKNLENDNPNVLRVKFENLINNYNFEIERICGFLKITEYEIISSLKMYDLSRSKRNVGIYKDFWDQKAIKLIEMELLQFCD